ncbi:MAG: NAD(P)/FAD-dependent oxidoreductase [Oscillospiraceae bacterium]|jgi:predicted Rossmann fold flavoprotein|nr:NAD(P)/FAD-dependent oxidoreductase [Oscillospiraceae bacterium]
MIYDAAVIGGGAAGMMAAVAAAERGRRVIVIERGAVLGRKLRITGKGRCNLTNNCDAREVIENIPTGGRFLQSAMRAFPPEKTMEFFESLGVPLKTERGRRVFPASDKAGDIADALVRRMERLGVRIRTARAGRIEAEDGEVRAVTAAGEKIYCGAAILATGGASYPKTGSTGDGYAMASRLGHAVIQPRASLVPLESPDPFCAEMQGLALKNVGVTVTDGGRKPVYKDFGELLFTHFGISGPLALSASAHMRPYESGKDWRVVIDLKPALSAEALDARVLRDLEKYKNRDFGNALRGLLPGLMIPAAAGRSGIGLAKKANSVTRAERRRLVGLLKGFDVRISGARPIEEAVITSGGVDTKEIVPATMGSKLVRGLYFAGEIINADAYTGGYNLQIAWATARAAGSAVPRKSP